MYVGMLLICMAFAGCMEGTMKEVSLTEVQCETKAQAAIADITKRLLEQGVMVRAQYKCVRMGQSAES